MSNFSSTWEILYLGVHSSGSADRSYGRGYLLGIDDGWFDGTVNAYFEVVADNADGVDRNVELRTYPGPVVQATCVIPAGSSAARVSASVPFTLLSGHQSYEINLKQSSSNGSVKVYSARIVVVVSGGTKGAFQYMLCARGYNESSFNADGAAESIWSTNNTTYAEPTPQSYFRLNKANWDSVSAWRLYTRLGANTRVRLVDGAGNEVVEHINVTGATEFTYTEFAHSAANWDDGEEFRLQARSNSALNQTLVFQCYLVAILDDLQLAESYLNITRRQESSSASLTVVHQRSRLVGFSSGLDHYHVVCGSEPSAGDSGHYIRDAGTSDSGTGGSDIVSSLVEHPSATKAVQIAQLSAIPDDEDRVIFHHERSTGTSSWWGAYLMVLVSATDAASVETDVSWSEDLVAEVFPVDEASLAHDVSWAEDPVAQVLDQVQFEDEVSWAAEVIGSIEPGAVFEEDVSWDEEVSAEVVNLVNGNPIVLAEIVLDSGSVEYSDDWVRTPLKIAEARVVGFGVYSRSMPVTQSFTQVGDGSVTLADPDGEIRALFALETPKRRLLKLWIGYEGLRRDLFQEVHGGGEIVGADFTDTTTKIQVIDHATKWLDEKIPKLITADNFTLTDEKFEGFAPIPLGIVSTDGLSEEGAWDCVRISETRWCVARFPLNTDTLSVYRRNPGAPRYKEKTSGFTWSTETIEIDGVDITFQHLDWNNVQDEGTEVRVSGHGMTIDGTAATEAEVNPTTALKNLILRVAGRDNTDLNNGKFNESRDELDTLGYQIGGVIKEQMTWREAITWWKRSFNLPVHIDRSGNVSVGLIYPSEENLVGFDHNFNILSGSVTQRLANPTANKFTYRYNLLPSGEWYSEQIYTSQLDRDTLGIDEQGDDIDMPLVRNAATAFAVAGDVSSYWSLSSHRFEHVSPLIPYFAQVDLAELVSLTYWAGINPQTAGFAGKKHTVYEVHLDLDKLELRVKTIRRNPPQETQSLVNGYWRENMIPGPWPGPAPEILNLMMAKGFSGPTLKMFDSVDWGKTWAEQEFSTTANIVSADSYQEPDNKTRVHVATQDVTGRVGYWRYSLKSRSFEVEDEEVAPALSDQSDVCVSLTVRNLSKEVVVCAATDLEHSGGKSYDRYTAYRRLSAGNWTEIPGVFPTVDEKNLKRSQDLYRCLRGERDRVHFGCALTVIGKQDQEWISTLRLGNGVHEPQIFWQAASNYYRARHNWGRATKYEREDANGDPEFRLLIPYRASWATPALLEFIDRDAIDSADGSKAGYAGYRWGLSAATVNAGSSASGNSLYPAMTAARLPDPTHPSAALGNVVPSKHYALFAVTSIGKYQEIFKSGGGIDSMLPAGDTDYKAGPQGFFSQPVSASAHIFVQSGRVWMARVFSIQGMDGPSGFELVAADQLPRDPGYDQAAFVAAAQS